MIRQINLNRLTLTGALMAATVVMVVINLSQPESASSLVNSVLTLFVAGLIVFGLLMINVLERRWDKQQYALQTVEADNIALMKRISQRADQLATLNQMSVLMTQTLSTSDVLDSIVSSAGLISQADAVGVFTLTDTHFELVRDAGFNDGNSPDLQPLTSPTMTSMSPVIIQNIARDSRVGQQTAAFREQGFLAILELPFVSNGRLLGVLCCYFRRENTIRDDEIGILLSFAALLSNALQNADRYEKTDQRREVAASNLQTVLDARETYTSMIVHDLRSPLTAVSTSLKLISETVPETSPQHAMINRLTSTGMRALRKVLSRVDSLLDIAKMESGMMNLHRTPTSVATLIESVLADLEPLATELGIQLTVNAESLPPLMLDADKVERTLLNLVDNALKYSPMNSVVRIEARRTEENDLRLSVADNGSGVPDAYKQRLFDRFVQIEERQVVRRGVGLGLSLCKAVADAHGGRIWIEDNPDGGAVFIVDLPMELAPINERPLDHPPVARNSTEPLRDPEATKKPLSPGEGQ